MTHLQDIQTQPHTGKFIRERRLRLGLRQVDLADDAGTPKSHLCNIEAGRREVGLDLLLRLLEALMLDVFVINQPRRR